MQQKSKYSKEVALEQLKQICSRTEKSRVDVRNKLRLWKMEDYFEEFINILLNEKFIDDERFCMAFINDKIQLQRWGKLKIRYQLRSRDLSENIISKAMATIDDESYQQMIKNELIKKLESMKITDLYKKRFKLYAFGNQRGYESDLLNTILDELFS